MGLRVMAVSAPDAKEGKVAQNTLSSQDPASLFNACRQAAALAEAGTGSWGRSNWAFSRQLRRESVLLMRSWDGDRGAFETALKRERPNVLFIGAMTLCFPGAIECAKLAKELFGDQVLVVLGGRHASETLYADPRAGGIAHHPASPLLLMRDGAIPHVFDLVVSGDGEHVIARLGELVDETERAGLPAARAAARAFEAADARGDWIVGWLSDGRIGAVTGRGGALDPDALPVPCEMFGARTSFNVFPGCRTAHVFSNTGRGCSYDCAFCSERRGVTGRLLKPATAAERLFRQLEAAARVIQEDSPSWSASAFCEDSVLMGGSPANMRRLIDLVSRSGLDMPFGGQLTVDQILNRKELLRDLFQVGLKYLFIGIETGDPATVGGMSKDVGSRNGRWLERTESALELLSDIGIQCGGALLFGLGESREDRRELFRRIRSWRYSGMPAVLSLNWAVQHPLQGMDGGTGYKYIDWATPPGPMLEAFSSFGEASVLYPIAGRKAAELSEVREVLDMYQEAMEVEAQTVDSMRPKRAVAGAWAAV